MPKLNKQQQQTVDSAESTGGAIGPLPEGRYSARLAKDVEVREGPQGTYWVWEFDNLVNLDTDANAPGRQWMNTSLSEKAAWKVKEVFDAFGYTTDTDTEELVGETVGLVVSQRLIEKGTRKGEMGNNIDRVFDLSAGDDAGEAWTG